MAISGQTAIYYKFTFQQVRDDVWFIINTYFPENPFAKKQKSRHHPYDNQNKIQDRFNLKQTSSKDKIKLSQYAKKLARRHLYPRFILDELVIYCVQLNRIRLSYSKMQKITSEAISTARNRLFNKLNLLLNQESRQVLGALLKIDESFYRLTLLKKDPKDFSTGEMRSEVTKQHDLNNIYKKTHDVIEKLNISAKNIEYFSEMAQFYTITKLKRFTKNQSRLYLMFYAHQRLLIINDHLLTFLTYRINKYFQEAELWAKDQISRKDEETIQQLAKAEKLIRLYSNKKVSDQDLRPNAFQIVPEDKIKQFARDLTAAEAKKDKYIWQSIEDRSKSIKLNIRPVFNAIQFICDDNPLQEAMKFLVTSVFNKKYQKYYPENQVPIDFIPKKLQARIIEKTQDPLDKRRKIAKINIPVL